MSSKKRGSYTLKAKLDVLAMKEREGLSTRETAKRARLGETTVRRWVQQADRMKELAKSAKIRMIRRIPRKRIGQHPQVEKKTFNWIVERNKQGIRVKDKYIQMRARQARDECLATMDDGPEKEALAKFQASKIWMQRFKSRHHLASRRHTTTHTMPVGFRASAMAFIESVQDIIEEHDISRSRIINADQVPRYFETDKTSTITQKGTREVLLRKASTSHKRFTFTPFITASGKMIIRHCLFSNLKKVPAHDPKCRVAVNKTGMWNDNILKDNIDFAISACRTPFNQAAHVLIILDSYGVHEKFVRLNCDAYKARNVHFVIVPPHMTGLLQPLDVGVNRSFQQSFNDKCEVYQSEAITKNIHKTKKGNICMPTVAMVTEWVSDWCDKVPEPMIRKAFNLCGLVPRCDFDVANLHQPLKEIYHHDFDVTHWIAKHAGAVHDSRIYIDDNAWNTFEGKHAFLHGVHSLLEEDNEPGAWTTATLKRICNTLKEDDFVKGLYTDADEVTINEGMNFTSGRFEFYAMSKLIQCQLHLVRLSENDFAVDRVIFGAEHDMVAAFFYKLNPLRVLVPETYDQDQFTFAENAPCNDDDDDEEESSQEMDRGDEDSEEGDEEMDDMIEYDDGSQSFENESDSDQAADQEVAEINRVEDEPDEREDEELKVD